MPVGVAARPLRTRNSPMRVRRWRNIISDITHSARVEGFETRNPKIISPMAEIAGKAKISEDTENDMYQIEISATSGDDVRTYSVSMTQKLHVQNGQLVAKGTQLSEGYLNIKELLEVRGTRETQLYLLSEIQNVYESQGIGIHD